MFKPKAAIPALLLALAGCASDGTVQDGGILTTRTACPGVGIPAGTGDITLFNPENSRDASAIDVVATITNVRSTCDDTGEYIVSNVTFDVYAQRRNASGAREVVLPYFASVIQGGANVVSKTENRVGLRFADGEYRASSSGSATARVLASAATLPEATQDRITRRRRTGDADAAIDPLSIPEVRLAVTRATFEVLVGFQLTPDQLRYNATR